MDEYFPSDPEHEEFSLVLPNAPGGPLTITQFTEYSFSSSLLTPVDTWSFTVEGSNLRELYGEALTTGAEAQLIIAGLVQSTGYVDSIEIDAGRSGGTVWRIEGRDRLSQPADACADPTISVKESMFLIDAMKLIFSDYGWAEDDDYADTNAISTSLSAGQDMRQKLRKSEGKGFGKRALKDYKMHQYRPYAHESALDFALRIVQRLGFWIWTTSDGSQLVVSDPEFDQEPTYHLIRSDSYTNVLDGTVKFSVAEQPTHIVADSYSSGGEFGRGRNKVIMANATVRVRGFDEDAYDDDGQLIPGKTPKVFPQLQKYKDAGATFVELPPAHGNFVPSYVARPRILYLHDDESHTLENLEAYVRQQMALLQRKSLEVRYTVAGHGQLVDGKFVPWLVDTVASVDDEVASLGEDLYVLSRTFKKSRRGGTSTELELIRLYTMSFSDEGGQAKTAAGKSTASQTRQTK